jgi:hypothetical protein
MKPNDENGVARERMSESDSKGSLVFVYNANSGLFNGMADAAHKIFSPATYACNLCALTYSAVGMRKGWKEFLDGLARPLEFLHADEFKKLNYHSVISLPAVFARVGDYMEILVDAKSINSCRTIDDLKGLIEEGLAVFDSRG